MAAELHHRNTSESNIPATSLHAGAMKSAHDAHPSGKEKHGTAMQIARGVSFAVYFTVCCLVYVFLFPRLADRTNGHLGSV
jgi:hypothetical protein